MHISFLNYTTLKAFGLIKEIRKEGIIKKSNYVFNLNNSNK